MREREEGTVHDSTRAPPEAQEPSGRNRDGGARTHQSTSADTDTARLPAGSSPPESEEVAKLALRSPTQRQAMVSRPEPRTEARAVM